MRALREQPRLVAAKLGLALVVLIAAVLLGSALASDGPEAPPDLRARLERSEQLLRDRSVKLERLRGQVEQLRRDLRAATPRERARARASQGLRRELRATRRNLARQRDQ